jgi:hypothetical protein
MNTKKKEPSTMEATLQTVSSVMTVIRDPAEIQAAFEGRLMAYGKPVLVSKGNNDMATTVAQIYRLFAAHKDMSGERFMLSSKHKGLVHRDRFGCISKLTNYEFSKYLENFCSFAELITSGTGTNLQLSVESPALVIRKQCPPFHAQIWQQRRWLQDSEAALFEWTA